MKFEIISWLDGGVLFSLETESLRICVEAAVKSGASLYGANLNGASLNGASLNGASLNGASLDRASLFGASLYGANGLKYFPIQIGGHKDWLCTTQNGDLQIGCYVKTFEEWMEEGFAEKLGKENGYSPLSVEIYKLHIEHIAKVSRLLWNKKDDEK
jgi:Pentapeptide repeats (8 copies)